MKASGARERQREESAPLVRRFAAKIAQASAGLPILDVACGSGRNAVPLLQLGCSVICIDRDLSHLRQLQPSEISSEQISPALIPLQMDLLKDDWPFERSSIGGIINVHFVSAQLFDVFQLSLISGGYLLLETPPGCGGNFVELPKAGAVRHSFDTRCDLEFYREHRVGPSGTDAVTVHMLARRRR